MYQPQLVHTPYPYADYPTPRGRSPSPSGYFRPHAGGGGDHRPPSSSQRAYSYTPNGSPHPRPPERRPSLYIPSDASHILARAAKEARNRRVVLQEELRTLSELLRTDISPCDAARMRSRLEQAQREYQRAWVEEADAQARVKASGGSDRFPYLVSPGDGPLRTFVPHPDAPDQPMIRDVPVSTLPTAPGRRVLKNIGTVSAMVSNRDNQKGSPEQITRLKARLSDQARRLRAEAVVSVVTEEGPYLSLVASGQAVTFFPLPPPRR